MTRDRGRAAASRSAAAILTLGACATFLVETSALAEANDDAFISYRYARNLVEGHGLVYNPGERVEGFTNLLWTLLVAAGMGLGVDAPQAGRVLGRASGLLLLVLTTAYAAQGLPRSRTWLAGLAPWLLLSFTAFPRWSTSGMETPLFAAALVAGLWMQARGRMGWSTAAAAVAVATRPEGALLALVVYAAPLAGARPLQARHLLWPGAFAAVLLGLTAWRLAYYGDVVPNTFHAKVGGLPAFRGVGYLVEFLIGGALYLLPPAAIACWREPSLRPGAALFGLVSIYVVAVGGDAFPHDRFLLPVVPALAVLALRGARIAWEARPALGAAVACGLILTAASEIGGWTDVARGEALRDAETRYRFVRRNAQRRAAVLARRHSEPPLVAAAGIGALGWYAELRIVDLFGLVEPTVARSRPADPGPFARPGHQRSNADHVLGLAPEYVFVPRRGSGVVAAAVHEIWRHPELQRRYRWDPEVSGYRRLAGRELDP